MKTIFRYILVTVTIFLSYGQMLSEDEFPLMENGIINTVMNPTGDKVIVTYRLSYNHETFLKAFDLYDREKDTFIMKFKDILDITIGACEDSNYFFVYTNDVVFGEINKLYIYSFADYELIDSISLDFNIRIYDQSRPILSDDLSYLTYLNTESHNVTRYNLNTKLIEFELDSNFIALSGNGNVAASKLNTNTVAVWDLSKKEIIDKIFLNDTVTDYASISNNGQYFIYGSQKDSVILVNKDGKILFSYEENYSNNSSKYSGLKLFNKISNKVAIRPNNTFSTLIIFDIEKNSAFHAPFYTGDLEYSKDYSKVYWSEISINSTFTIFAIIGDKNTKEFVDSKYIFFLEARDVYTDEILRIFPEGHYSNIYSSAINSNGTLLATSAKDNTYVWEGTSNDNPEFWLKPPRAVKFLNEAGIVAFTPENNFLMIANDNKIKFLNLKDYKFATEYLLENQVIRGIHISDYNSIMIIKTESDIFFIKYPSLKIINQHKSVTQLTKLTKEKDKLITISNNKVIIYETKSGDVIKEILIDTNFVNLNKIIDISYDYRYLILNQRTGEEFNSFYSMIWDLEKNDTLKGFYTDSYFLPGEEKYLMSWGYKSYLSDDIRAVKYLDKDSAFTCKYYDRGFSSWGIRSRFQYAKVFDNSDYFFVFFKTSEFFFGKVCDSILNYDFLSYPEEKPVTNPYVFPNPATDRVIIPLQSEFAGSSRPLISIYDILGNRMDFELEQSDSKFIIDCTKSQAGMYYYVITGDNHTQSGNFLVSR